jgi:hypothetical protein
MTVEDLHKYKNELTAGLNRNLSEFEKNFFLVSAGTFTFSVTFIKDIVKIQGSSHIFFLFFAWALIALSVGFIMYAFLASANKSGEIWTYVDNFITSNSLFTASTAINDLQANQIKKDILDILNKSKKHLKAVRYVASATFVVGIFSFAFFIAINLVAEQNKPAPKEDPSKISAISIVIGQARFDTPFLL